MLPYLNFLYLETFQAGLSWLTILKKRENFRKAFDNFDYKKISTYKQSKIDALLQDAGIIRNKLKIKATVTNAQAFYRSYRKNLEVLATYIWGFVNGKTIKNSLADHRDAPAKTSLSDALSKDLKETWVSSLLEVPWFMPICRQQEW